MTGGPGANDPARFRAPRIDLFGLLPLAFGVSADQIAGLGLLIGSSQGKSVRDGFLQPRVVDKTGLTGKYTFILEYYDASHTPAGVPLFSPGAFSGAASDPDGGGPSIFEAIQKQLGLRLDKTADIPMDVIVVESVDKVPTAN